MSEAFERVFPHCPNCGRVCATPELPSRYGRLKFFGEMTLEEKIGWFAQVCECGAKFDAQFYRPQQKGRAAD